MSITSVQHGAVQTAYVGSATYSLDKTNQNLITYWPQPYVTATNILAATTNIICTATDTSLTFPDANQVSTGYNVFIKSGTTSSQRFNVLDNAGNLIQVIAPGEIWWIQLDAYTANTTAGTWSSIQMGVGTTTIDVNTIKGYGLKVLPTPGTELSTYTPVSTITTTTYTVQATDQSSMLLLNGVSTVDLPTLTTTQQGGFYFSFNNISAIPVTFSSVATINGLASPPGLVIYPNQTGTLVQDSSGNWWTLGLGQGFTFAQTVITIPLSGATLDLTGTQLSNFVLQFTGNLTENLTVYFGTTPSNWYIQNACTTSPGITLKICAGIATTPKGTSIPLESNQNYIVYLAPNPNDGILQLYEAPTLADPTTFNAVDGSALDPSFAFINDPHSGMFLQSASNPSITANSSEIARFEGVTNTAVQILANPNATNANRPTFSFIGETTTGMGASTTPTLDLYANNVKVLTSTATTVSCPVALTVTGASTLTGGAVINAPSTLSGSGSINISGNITTSAGTLNVAGLSTLTGGFTSAAASTITSGGLTVTGTTVLNTPLGIAYGGTGAKTQQTAAINIFPVTTGRGAFSWFDSTDWITTLSPNGNSVVPFYNGSIWQLYNLSAITQPTITLVSASNGWAGITLPPDGTYSLRLVVSGGVPTYSWV
jgi:hypothetical protein